MIVTGHHVVEWVAKKTHEFGNFGASVGIGVEKNGELVAGVVYSDYNGVNFVAHIASDGSKRWMTKEYLWLIFHYPFIQVNVNRITCLIGEANKESVSLCEHFGFELEARLKGAHASGDLLIYCLWKKDCRFLGSQYENIYKMRLRLAA